MAKRFRPDSGSDISALDESLSYLDLEKATSSSIASKGVLLLNKSYDALMRKLTHTDKSLSKLDKLDNFDEIETAVTKIDTRMDNAEHRLDKTESAVSVVEKSAQFLSDKYDDIYI